MKRAIVTIATMMIAAPAIAQEFTYEPPGVLVPGSGMGRRDDMVYAPGIRFPIEVAPAYPNSQVWGVGGSQGPSGSQCDPRNYDYPWHDNFCESRSWDMPLCPAGVGHQGQDIRPSTCDDDTHWAVAAEDGTVTGIGGYAVYFLGDSGTLHRYLHMARSSIVVRESQRLRRGDRMGRVSNEFGGTPTTIHLHYDLQQNVRGLGMVFVPTYMSLVRSYEELLGVEAMPCAVIPAEGATLDDAGPCLSLFGPTRYWRVETTGGHEGGFRWTNGYEGPTPSNWAQWRLHFAAAGTYAVEVNVVPPFNTSTRVPYVVRHAGEETAIVVDQSTATGWVRLGVLDFAEGGDQLVRVADNTGEIEMDRHITVDAVRLVPADALPPDAGVTEDAGAVVIADSGVEAEPDAGSDAAVVRFEGEVEAGCSCRTSGARGSRGAMLATLPLLAVIAIAARRRRRR